MAFRRSQKLRKCADMPSGCINNAAFTNSRLFLFWLAVMVAAITKRGCIGLLTHTEQGLFRLDKLCFKASERHPFDGFVFAVTKRLLFTQSACTPGIDFFRYYFNHHRF